jgi:hypothetical protein
MNEIIDDNNEIKTCSWEIDGKKIITPSKKYLTNDEKIILIERAKVHDMDKMTLYFFREKEKASKYHREHSTHHIKH